MAFVMRVRIDNNEFTVRWDNGEIDGTAGVGPWIDFLSRTTERLYVPEIPLDPKNLDDPLTVYFLILQNVDEVLSESGDIPTVPPHEVARAV